MFFNFLFHSIISLTFTSASNLSTKCFTRWSLKLNWYYIERSFRIKEMLNDPWKAQIPVLNLFPWLYPSIHSSDSVLIYTFYMFTNQLLNSAAWYFEMVLKPAHNFIRCSIKLFSTVEIPFRSFQGICNCWCI